MNRLEGRVALVTGAASGIGKATAQRLAEEGAAVLVTDIQVEAGQTTAKEIAAAGGRAAFVRHDVASEAEWEAACARAVEEFGGLDILVNNAGMGDIATIEETSLADYERTDLHRPDRRLPRHEGGRATQAVGARLGHQHQLHLRRQRRLR